MPKTLIQKSSVTTSEGEDLTHYDLGCECGYTAIGFPTRKLADNRKSEHLAEHETGEPAPPINDAFTTEEQSAADRIADALAAARNGRS